MGVPSIEAEEAAASLLSEMIHVPIASLPGCLLLRVVDCIVDRIVLDHTAHDLILHMWSRKQSRRWPRNEAT